MPLSPILERNTFQCSYSLHTLYLALNIHPQKLRVATALQTVTKAEIRRPAAPEARLLSVASWDEELLSQHEMGALESAPLAAAGGEMETCSTAVTLVADGEDPTQANHYCSVLIA